MQSNAGPTIPRHRETRHQLKTGLHQHRIFRRQFERCKRCTSRMWLSQDRQLGAGANTGPGTTRGGSTAHDDQSIVPVSYLRCSSACSLRRCNYSIVFVVHCQLSDHLSHSSRFPSQYSFRALVSITGTLSYRLMPSASLLFSTERHSGVACQIRLTGASALGPDRGVEAI